MATLKEIQEETNKDFKIVLMDSYIKSLSFEIELLKSDVELEKSKCEIVQRHFEETLKELYK